MSATWTAMTASELGREIEAGRINPVELAEFFLDAVARHPLGERIYARLTPRRARSMAMAAHGRAKAGLRLGLLDGVPLSWKDLFDTAGALTEAGSGLLKGRMPGTDAEVLATATRGGSVCLGKTHMTELAFSGLGLNPVTATPPCINDDRAVPGGSSSGGAASVAFGLAPAAVGSDTGGSVRLPAAWNDLVGLKTTHGRLSLAGVVPLIPRFDTVGPLAKSVEDCAEILALLEGRRAADLTGAGIAGARLAVLDTVAMDGLRERPALGFEGAVDRLSVAGAEITHIAAPEVAEALALGTVLFPAEAWATWGEAIEAAPEKMFPPVLARFRSGAKVLAADWIRAWTGLERVRRQWAERVAGFDAVLVPTSPILPPDRERLLTDPDFFTAENLLALRNTRIGNLMGGCVLTLPTGQPSCGRSLMAGPGQEERLLRLGAGAARALG